MHDITLCCRYIITTQPKSDWIVYIIPCLSICVTIGIAIWQFRANSREKEATRKAEVEYNLLREIHGACDNMLTLAFSYNRHILAWLYFFQMYDRKKEYKDYYLTLCLKNYDLSEQDSKEYYENWSMLNKNISVIRKYLNPEKANKIIILVEEPGEEFAQSYMNINWGETPDDATRAHEAAYAGIPDYVLNQSKLKNVDDIRRIISGISKEGIEPDEPKTGD